MNGKIHWIVRIMGLLGLLALSACAMVPATGGSGAGVATATQEENTHVATVPPTEVISTIATEPVINTMPTPEVSTAVSVGMSGTAVVSGTAIVIMPGGQSETPVPQPTLAPGEQLVITLNSANQTYHLKVGDRFLVNMGADSINIYNWDVEITDQTVVSRVMGVLVIRGAQGLYEAKAPGTTTLMITGDPLCRQSKPACMMPSRIITVNLVVEP